MRPTSASASLTWYGMRSRITLASVTSDCGRSRLTDASPNVGSPLRAQATRSLCGKRTRCFACAQHDNASGYRVSARLPVLRLLLDRKVVAVPPFGPGAVVVLDVRVAKHV